MMIRFRIPVGRLARQHHNQALSQRFNILYFGRDEFSCQVFEELYNATGSTFPTFFLGPLSKLTQAARQMSGKIFSLRHSRIK
jgi:hypothetical protein